MPVTLAINLPDALARPIQQIAQTAGISAENVIIAALEQDFSDPALAYNVKNRREPSGRICAGLHNNSVKTFYVSPIWEDPNQK